MDPTAPELLSRDELKYLSDSSDDDSYHIVYSSDYDVDINNNNTENSSQDL